MNNSSIAISDFEIIKEIGCGSFGKVHLVKSKQDAKLYAMKSVLFSKLNSKEKDNALNEVRLLASMTIPYVIGYKTSFFDNHTQCLNVVMEYADGGDLQNKILAQQNTVGQGFNEQYIWKVAYQILNGLRKLHAHNIIHRDIKSANIFFVNEIAKLGDLNVSKVVELGWCETQTGTPYYTSPEIWNGNKYSSKCDIWSLGCLIYEMCQLKPPFRAPDLPTLFRKVVVGEYKQISDHYSQQMKDLIKQCLTVDDELRPSAAALLDVGILSGLELSFESFRHQDQQIDLLDPIKCPRVLKFLNSRLPKNKLNQNSSKKNVNFVTKKQIEKESIKEKQCISIRKILSEKVIYVDNEDSNKNKITSKKHIKLPPLDKQLLGVQPLQFTVKRKLKQSRTKLFDKQNRKQLEL